MSDDDVVEVDPRIEAAIKRLTRLTTDNAIQWELVSSSRSDAFAYSTARTTVVLGSKDRDSLPPIILAIRDSSGTVVERLATHDLDQEDESSRAFQDEIVELYRLARRSALRVDDVLDSLVADLETEPEGDMEQES